MLTGDSRLFGAGGGGDDASLGLRWCWADFEDARARLLLFVLSSILGFRFFRHRSSSSVSQTTPDEVDPDG